MTLRVAADLVAELTGRGQTLAVAESLTGGLVAGAVTDVPGASAVFVGGLVAYSTELKRTLLGVPTEILDDSGAVSEECARAMAVGIRGLLGTDWALSTTGVAGPDGQEGKPPGRVFLAVAGPDGVVAGRLDLSGGRPAVRRATVDAALETALRSVRGSG